MVNNRISKSELDALVRRINELKNNHPMPYDTETRRWLVGAVYIQGAYGGFALEEVATDSGGTRNVFGGYRPKRELYQLMHAYLKGYTDK